MENKPWAAAALDAVSASRAQIADRLVTPWWYHPILGVMLGLQALVVGAAFGGAGLALMIVPILGMLGLATLYSHLTGIDVTSLGARGTRSSRLQWMLFGLGVGGLAVSVVFGDLLSIEWVPWVIGAALVVATTVVGRAYDDALRAELRESVA